MAEEKGLIALNHCNNIANTIINKLGGTGYKPSEWREKVNLLGISNADKAEVLAGLTPEASGEEAGLIDLETINGLAEELNEKYTTIRGFKPSEMRGAISAMSPLEEKTATGSIAHYTDGAKNTPLTKCEVMLSPSVAGRNPAAVSGSIVSFSDSAEVGLKACKVTIPASLSGVSSVNVEGTGANLWTLGDQNITTTYVTFTLDKPLPSGTYTISAILNSSFTYAHMRFRREDGSAITQAVINSGSPDRTSATVTINEPTYRIYLYSAGGQSGYTAEWKDIQIQAGSVVTDYEPYNGKTYAADLGRTVYGGEVDFANGSGTENTGKATFTGSENWQLYSNETFWYTTITADHIKTLQDCTTSNGVVVRFQSTSGQLRVYLASNVGVVDTTTDMNALLSNGVSFNYPYETPQAFTFPRVPIVPKAGVNTMWSAGDISVDYYKDGYGYEEVKVYHQGANFIDDTLEGIEQGTINGGSGRNNSATNRVRVANYTRLPLDKIISSYTLTIPSGFKLAMRFYTEDKTFIQPPGWAQVFITSIPSDYIGRGVAFARFVFAKTDDSNITPEDIANAGFILNYGSSADAYEPYTEPEEKIKDLGGIVYGGSYDFVAGEVKVTYKRADLGALTWVKFPTAGYADLYYTDDLKEEIGATSGSQIHGLCYEFEVVTNDGHDGSDSSATPQPYNTIRFRASDGRIYLKVAGYTTAAEMKAGVAGVMLLYALHDPEAIEGTPEAIKSYFGVNTIWNEENDTTVGYYADIDLSSNTQNALNMVNLSQEEIE